jgi:phenylalanine-4-hydroxylase
MLKSRKVKPSRSFDPVYDDKHWQVLFDTHFQSLQSLNAISTLWISGFSKLGIDQSKRPRAEDLTRVVYPYTGFSFIQSNKSIILEQDDWYKMIANSQMPFTCFLRTPAELGYCDEPDIWHDIMGHVPFLAEKNYANMYRLLARTYLRAHEANRQDLLQQLDFIGGLIIELGLIKEPSGIKAFGATLYSSSEVIEAFKPENQKVFTTESLFSGESYDRHRFQGKYYVFESLEQLVELIKQLASRC